MGALSQDYGILIHYVVSHILYYCTNEGPSIKKFEQIITATDWLVIKNGQVY